jgi:hypothetical protein
LADRVIDEAVARRDADQHLEVAEPSAFPFWRKLTYAAVGAATALLVAFLCLRHGSVAPDLPAAAAFARITADQMRVHARLFSEMEHLFADRLRWVAESNGDVGLGVEALRGASSVNSAPLLVRLTVVSRKEGTREWAPTWSADVLLRGEEVVEVAPNRRADNRLALWVYPLGDGRIAADTSLSLSKPVPVSSKVSTVVQEGQPSELISVRVGGTEYRVFQAVETVGKRLQG